MNAKITDIKKFKGLIVMTNENPHKPNFYELQDLFRPEETMTRDEMTAVLEMTTIYSPECLEKMSLEELKKTFQEKQE